MTDMDETRSVKHHRVGTIVLGLSACGYPLTQVVIRRLGRAGAGIVETVCVGLVVRDAALIAAGTPRRLRLTPALLLWLELGAGTASAVTGLQPLLRPRSDRRAGRARPSAVEIVRRAAVAALFGLHTIRFWIYLQPDQGRRTAAGLEVR